ncbi:winged helix-turn-helix domain-containing protein [Ferrimonas aestuarii]|uniref:winged helix-turn-helix domain-containing protein n=1 Tax=Ferrimonas aestuarii TaxID=2569539 RepID=UPI0022771E8F|nr:winged helix-turn-helix domain-containing protein [Ferrimonas aestuarii]
MTILNINKDLSLDIQNLCLRDSRDETLTSLTFAETAVLKCLLEHRNDICTKEQLLEQGWPERVVAPSSLIQCISTLRKKLEAYPEIALKTVARRGYQVVVMKDEDEEVAIEQAASDSDKRLKNRKWVALVALVVAVGCVSWGIAWLFKGNPTSAWHWTDSKEIHVGDSQGKTELLTTTKHAIADMSRWQRHFESKLERNMLPPFRAFAVTDGLNDSIALCPHYEDGQCPGHDIINLNFPVTERVNMDLPSFFELAKIMERRIRYNRIELPKTGYHQGELTESMYSADIYFPRNEQLLVRVDHNISMVYRDESKGMFFASFCVTDQDCKTSPIKYEFEGDFERVQTEIDGHPVDLFKVTTNQRVLHKPELVTEAALPFYRELRRNSLSNEPLYFCRFYRDDNSSAWVIPFYGQTVAWMKQSTMQM